MLLVALASAASIGCGSYSHDKTIHNVVATGWDNGGAVVSLAEVIRLRWGFVGINPPHTYPKTSVERLGQVVRHGTVVRPVSGRLTEWPRAYLRRNRGGFVVASSGFGCHLVTLTGEVTDCPGVVADKRVLYFMPASDRMLLRGRATPGGSAAPDVLDALYLLALNDNEMSVLNDPFLELPARAPDELGCPHTSYIALAADESAWAVACPYGGLWVVTRNAGATLLARYDEVLTKPHSLYGTAQTEDYQRTFEQSFGLAWSPDASQVYYCPSVDKKAVLITVATRQVRPMATCLGGASWSPDGRRIAGTRAGMVADQIVLR